MDTSTPSCPQCHYYILTNWRSHSPDFPFNDWEIVEREDIQVGTHAPVAVFQGKAACKACKKVHHFFCTYGEGYGFMA